LAFGGKIQRKSYVKSGAKRRFLAFGSQIQGNFFVKSGAKRRFFGFWRLNIKEILCKIRREAPFFWLLEAKYKGNSL
jgi:hypothetical protein